MSAPMKVWVVVEHTKDGILSTSLEAIGLAKTLAPAGATAVLAGESGPARAATLLGAAVILKAAGKALTLAEGIDLATAALDSGAAREVLERLRELGS